MALRREAESCSVLPLYPGSAEDASEDADDAVAAAFLWLEFKAC